jgi:hypothetical protein
MAFLSGDRLVASRLNHIQPVTYGPAVCDSVLTTTSTTYANISGCSITFDTETDGAVVVMTGVFDAAVGNIGTGNDMNGRIMLDGVAEPVLAKHQMDELDRDSVACVNRNTISTAGSHTVLLQGALSTSDGVDSGTFQLFTHLTVEVYEVP